MCVCAYVCACAYVCVGLRVRVSACNRATIRIVARMPQQKATKTDVHKLCKTTAWFWMSQWRGRGRPLWGRAIIIGVLKVSSRCETQRNQNIWSSGCLFCEATNTLCVVKYPQTTWKFAYIQKNSFVSVPTFFWRFQGWLCDLYRSRPTIAWGGGEGWSPTAPATSVSGTKSGAENYAQGHGGSERRRGYTGKSCCRRNSSRAGPGLVRVFRLPPGGAVISTLTKCGEGRLR